MFIRIMLLLSVLLLTGCPPVFRLGKTVSIEETILLSAYIPAFYAAPGDTVPIVVIVENHGLMYLNGRVKVEVIQHPPGQRLDPDSTRVTTVSRFGREAQPSGYEWVNLSPEGFKAYYGIIIVDAYVATGMLELEARLTLEEDEPDKMVGVRKLSTRDFGTSIWLELGPQAKAPPQAKG